ncbi:MAG: cyclic nucleotide-binding domain-containing protein [Candidatus Cloacimonadota bacterium]|nr:MAG: cyclic nucleotide-binding domain-containing protein [Candidatus Cloacimonadota bacterium]
METKTSILKKIYLFQYLDDNELEHILNIASAKIYKEEAVVFNEGEKGDAFYVVLKGSVRISTVVPGVGEEALAVLKKGNYFGEMALIDNAPRSAAAVANEDTVLLKITDANFRNLLVNDRKLAYKLLWGLVKTFSKRLRETDNKLKNILAIAKNF